MSAISFIIKKQNSTPVFRNLLLSSSGLVGCVQLLAAGCDVNDTYVTNGLGLIDNGPLTHIFYSQDELTCLDSTNTRYNSSSISLDKPLIATSQYMNSINQFDFSSNIYTIEFWYYTTSITTYKTLCRMESRTIELNKWSSAIGYIQTEAGKIQITNFDTHIFTFEETLNVNTWYHVAFVADGTNINLYLNGVKSSTSADCTMYNQVGPYTSSFSNYDFEVEMLSGCVSGKPRITKEVSRYTSNFTPLAYGTDGSWSLSQLNDPYWKDVVFYINEDISPLGDYRVVWDSSMSPNRINTYGSSSGNHRILLASNYSLTIMNHIHLNYRYFLKSNIHTSTNLNWYPQEPFPQLSQGRIYTLEYQIYIPDTVTVWTPIIGTLKGPQIGMWLTTDKHICFGTLKLDTSLYDYNVGHWVGTYPPTQLVDTLSLTSPITTGWHHIAVVYDGGANTVMYIDGITSSTMASQTLSVDTTQNGFGILIGADSSNVLLDDLRLTLEVARYTTDFTPPNSSLPIGSSDTYWDNVWILLQGGDTERQYVPSRIGKNIVLHGNTQVLTTPVAVTDTKTTPKGSTLFFDNPTKGETESWATVACEMYNPYTWSITDTGFTAELWVNTKDSRTAKLVSTRSSDESGWEVWLNGLEIRVQIHGVGVFNTSTALTINTWYHIAFTYDPTSHSIKIFINGVLESTSTSVSPTNGMKWRVLDIGAPMNGPFPTTESFNGYIQDLRITNKCLYTEDFIPRTTTFGLTTY